MAVGILSARMPVYLVDKPLGPTSHDVVAQARRSLGTRRVGHAGTLDPLASGLLVLLVDDATKLSPFLGGEDKAYLAWVSFGAATPTLDAEGPILEEADASHVGAAGIRAALPPFLELREQVPPAYSAVKRGGVKGYEAARRGEDLDLQARPARYRQIELLGVAPARDALPGRFAPADGGWAPSPEGRAFDLPEALGTHPTALLRLEVEAGTYIRSFARDLGVALGAPAHLSGLIRTRVGAHDLQAAVPVGALAEATGLRLADAVPMPRVTLSAEDADRVRLGQRLPLPLAERSALVDPEGRLVAVAETVDGRMQLLRVWN